MRERWTSLPSPSKYAPAMEYIVLCAYDIHDFDDVLNGWGIFWGWGKTGFNLSRTWNPTTHAMITDCQRYMSACYSGYATEAAKPAVRTHVHSTYACTYVTNIRTYFCTYIRTYTHAHIRTHALTHVRTQVHTYARQWVHKYVHAYVHTYVRTYVRTFRLCVRSVPCSIGV